MITVGILAVTHESIELALKELLRIDKEKEKI